MAVLIIKNTHTEGPGTIEGFLKTASIPFVVSEIGSGEQPPDIEGFDSLIIMGGPMGVYEMEKYPFLKKEAKIIEKTINRGVRVLGICLGSQMIAHVLGARVYPGTEKEIGWYDVHVTLDGARDHVFRTLTEPASSCFPAFQWHGDTFDLPQGAIRLASSKLYMNQAFRYGDNCYALQFHIEVTPDMIREWFSDINSMDLMAISNETGRLYPRCMLRANLFYKFFFERS
ncbi:MAG: type 1 glutamine amidotransferase [Nitrospirae bacterium]|nr:type 1 glutamine amidotransferase [Nitrospirota bacterium]